MDLNWDHVSSAIATPREERTPYESGLVRAADQYLTEMRRKAQTATPVDWTAVRRASASSPRDETEWELVDAYAR